MRALVAQLKLILVVGGLGRPHGSTKPPMGRAIGHLNESAGFLAGGVRGWLRGWLREAECESVKTDESLLASFGFQRCSCVAAAAAASEWLQSCIRRTGLAARTPLIPAA